MVFYLQTVFVMVVVLYTAFIKATVILPVRGLLSLFLFMLLSLAFRREFVAAFRNHPLTVLTFAALTLVGVVLTLANGRDFGEAFGFALSNLIQPLLILVSTYVLLQLTSVRFVAVVFIGSALITGAVAILQFADIAPAWRLREWLGQIQGSPASLEATVRDRSRPVGLSLTPIIFSYHIASAYILANFLRWREEVSGALYAAVVLAMLVMAVSCGTRSLALAILAHELLTAGLRMRLQTIVWVAALLIAGMAGLVFLEAIGSRVATLDDASAQGRLVLYTYGLRLAADYPFGLGWGFVPGDLAWLYWEHLSGFVNSDGVFRLGIHNGFLNFFLNYGLFGCAVIAAAACIKPRKFVFITVGSTAYIVNAFFHNNGFFLGDYYYWFAFAVFLHLYQPAGSAVSEGVVPRGQRRPTPGFQT